MAECRKLTKDEFTRLLNEAPESETRNLKWILSDLDIYDFFDRYALEHFGILSDNRPLYWGVLDKNKAIWSVVNKDVKEQISLYKYTKRKLQELFKKYGEFTTTMEIHNIKNVNWVKRLGFNVLNEDDNIITLTFQGF